MHENLSLKYVIFMKHLPSYTVQPTHNSPNILMFFAKLKLLPNVLTDQCLHLQGKVLPPPPHLTLEDYDTRILIDNGNYSPNSTPHPIKQHHCQNLKWHQKERKKEIAWQEKRNKDHEETGCKDEGAWTSGPGTRTRVATDGPKTMCSTSKVYWLLTNQTMALISVHV